MDFLSLSGENKEWELGPKEWMKECHFEMVTPETLKRVVDECLAADIFGSDIEGTGLDSRVFAGKTNDTIVGICLAPNEKTGYYIPLFHKDSPHNIPRSVAEPELIRLFKGHTVWHNAAFDHEFLEHPGGTPYADFDDVRLWEDTMILKFCLDSRSKKLGLKGLALSDLGLEMYELDELFPESHNNDKKLKHEKNFSLLDPSAPGCLYYACADAMCTLRLYNKYYAEAVTSPAPGQPNLKAIYTIEKAAVAAGRWMEREGMKISMEKVQELMALANRDLIACTDLVYNSVSEVLKRDVTPGFFKWLKANFDPDCGDPITEWRKQAVSLSQIDYPDPKGEIYDEVKRKSWPAVYDVFSPQQLGKMFEEAEVPGLSYTEKSKQVATDADTLDALIEEQGVEFGWIRAIGTMRTVIKAMSSYLYPLMKTVPDNGRVKIRFKQLGTDTGRYATPTGKSGGREELEGLPLINFHSIPNTYNDPLNPRPPSMSRLRETVVSEEGFFIVSVDFSGEELRIVTNISRERKWVKAFFSCVDCGAEFPLGDPEHWPPPPPPETCTVCGKGKTGDLHTLTADALYPGARATDSPETWKVKRGNGKIANFLLLYGGGGGGLSAGIGVDKHEGYRMARNFKTSYVDLAGWWERTRVEARKTGYVLTPFGRKYPVPDILPGAKMMNGEPVPEFFRAKAERNAINGPIQACIHPDSRIPTDLGLLRVEDLHRITDGRTFQVWTGLHWSDAETVRSEAKETVVTIFNQGHHIKTSSDHRFYVWKDGVGLDWAAQSELEEGSWVAQSLEPLEWGCPQYHWSSVACPRSGYLFEKGTTPHNAKQFEISGNSSVLWEFLGMVYGDGSILDDHFSLTFGECKVAGDQGPSALEYAEAFAEDLRGLGLEPRIVERPKENFRSVWQLSVYNKAFRTFCKDVLGVETQNTYTKRFPRALWSESQCNRAAFLKGYFSADGTVSAVGDVVSVRSVNPGLLEDTNQLLRTLGIRSSVRYKSQYVTVLDRVLFAEKIGFNRSHKQSRLDNSLVSRWAHKTQGAPSGLVRRVGEAVRASTMYGPLLAKEKSAVLRLVAGSGSLWQCRKYFDLLPESEQCSDLKRALSFGWSQVTEVQATGESVEMYDLQVHDHDHAFVCDGVVVHNCGADFIKIAMAMTYRKLKKMGMLDRVRLIATMHDELVWEIHGSVLTEIIPVIVDTMTNNAMIRRLKWPIPFTSDVEVGLDFTVPWNYKKCADKGKWPAELLPYVGEGKEIQFDLVDRTKPAPPPGMLEMIKQVPAAPEVSRESSDPIFRFRVTFSTSSINAMLLAEAIAESANSGTRILMLEDASGNPFDDWVQYTMDGKPIRVNHHVFRDNLRKRGL